MLRAGRAARSLRSSTSLRWTAPITTSRPSARSCHQSSAIWSRSASLLCAMVTRPCSSRRRTASSVKPLRSAAATTRSSGSHLPAVLDELDDLDPTRERGEQPAGFDRRELLRVTDEDHLGFGSVCLADEVGHQLGAEHPGLVDHQDIARSQLATTGFEVGVQRVSGRGGDAGTRLQLSRGSCGEADADDAVAGALEGLAHASSVNVLPAPARPMTTSTWPAGPRHSCSTIRCCSRLSDGRDETASAHRLIVGSVGIALRRRLQRRDTLRSAVRIACVVHRPSATSIASGGVPRRSSARSRISSSEAPCRAALAAARTESRRSKVACSSVSIADKLAVARPGASACATTRGTLERSKRWSPARCRHSARSSSSVMPVSFGFRVFSVAIRAPSPEWSPSRFHLGDDLGAATREGAPHVGADAGDLGDTVPIHLVEDQTEPDDELPAQRRLEDRLGGVALSVERLAVERGAPAVGSFGDVEDGPVEVDARVTEAARAMQEDRPRNPLPGSTTAPACPRRTKQASIRGSARLRLGPRRATPRPGGRRRRSRVPRSRTRTSTATA